MTYNPPQPRLAYGLTIELLQTNPRIWRDIGVPGEITLDRLHDVLQIVMGWDDCHLHRFTIDGRSYSKSPEEDFEGEEECNCRLCDLVKNDATVFRYKYFGDRWDHQITVRKIEAVPENSPAMLACFAGERCSPPEDIGGIPAYEMLLERFDHPKKGKRNPKRRHSGQQFNPDYFDLDEINLALYKYLRWSRPRAATWTGDVIWRLQSPK